MLSFKEQAQRELPAAERAVQEAKQRIEQLEAQVAQGKTSGETVRLLHTMKQTYSLQLGHVEVLKREIAEGL